MPLGILFWVLMVVSLVFNFWSYRNPTQPYGWGGGLLVFILLAILGWKLFGSVIQ